MAFRDEEPALRARVRDLEDRLAESEREAAKLRGESMESVDARPSERVHERTLPFVVDEAALVAMADALRARLGLEATQVGRTLRAKRPRRDAAGRPAMEVEVRVGDGETSIRVVGDSSDLGLRQWVAPGVITLGAALPTLGILLDVQAPIHAAWILPSVLLASVAWVRRSVRRQSVREAESARGVFETLVAIASERAPAPRVRVEDEASVEGEEVVVAPSQQEKVDEAE